MPDAMLAGGLTDIALRLLVAALVGGALGVNREWHGQDVGVRTLALVSLGSALVAVSTLHFAALNADSGAVSRTLQGVIQGVMTGIGFLGAGAVLRVRQDAHVKGLTTAATVWVTAALGIACALADWRVVAIGVTITLLVLIALHPIDVWIDRHRRRDAPNPPDKTP